jgi:hypothetical protein
MEALLALDAGSLRLQCTWHRISSVEQPIVYSNIIEISLHG